MAGRSFLFTISSGVALDKFNTCVTVSCRGDQGAHQFFFDSANMLSAIGDGSIKLSLADGSLVRFHIVGANVVFEDGVCRIDCSDYQRL